jgi:hypothetical protein
MPAWVRPTVHAISWVPMAAVVTCLAAVTGLAALAGAWPVGLVGLAAAAIAAALVAGLHDPAAALLAAVPTSAAVRRGRRLLALVPAGLAAWTGWLALGHRWAPGLGWPLAGFLALSVAGTAAATWGPLWLGVGLPLAWAVLARAGDLDWELQPELVTIAAGAALWAGRDR